MSWTVKAELANQELTLGVGLPLHDALEFHQVLTDHVEMAYRSATIRPSNESVTGLKMKANLFLSLPHEIYFQASYLKQH
ncbi:MAG: hypothetical protein LCH85_22090 [Chloroflexi bacterium]|nr:hypothetical protein [Chloroflexota bacterium]